MHAASRKMHPNEKIIRDEGTTSSTALSSLSASQQLGEEENTYATLDLFIFQHAVTPKHRRVSDR